MTDEPRYDDSPQLLERASAALHRPVRGPLPIIDNAESYTAIQPGMVLRLGAADYYVLGEAKEGRFGIDDQPKLWVKYGIDLADGSRKILKLPFHEQFETHIGPVTVRLRRDPDKESRIIDLMAGDARFMQGHTVHDRHGNNIRVIDVIRGRSLYEVIEGLDLPHERYFHELLPGILARLLESLEGLARLHERGEQHGDVRGDHLFIEGGTGRYRWIDFDYATNFRDYDVWALGDVLTFVVGGGAHTCQTAQRALDDAGRGVRIHSRDGLMLLPYRLVNLRKLFPYIPPALHEILMSFSQDNLDFWEDMGQLVAAVRGVVAAG